MTSRSFGFDIAAAAKFCVAVAHLKAIRSMG